MLVEVIFFAIVFLLLDSKTTKVHKDSADALTWLTCLISNPDNKNACLKDTHSWMVNYSAVSAVLIMLSLIGICVFCLLFRTSILTGWREWVDQNITHRKGAQPYSPQIRHLGIVSPAESIRSHSPHGPAPGYPHHTASPLSAGTAGSDGKAASPYDPTAPKPALGSDYYDVSAYRGRPSGDAATAAPDRYWHPNPNVQAAQREGIMRTLRLARARAQSAIQGQGQSRYPYANTPSAYPQPPARGAAELPPESSVNKEYYAH